SSLEEPVPVFVGAGFVVLIVSVAPGTLMSCFLSKSGASVGLSAPAGAATAGSLAADPGSASPRRSVSFRCPFPAASQSSASLATTAPCLRLGRRLYRHLCRP